MNKRKISDVSRRQFLKTSLVATAAAATATTWSYSCGSDVTNNNNGPLRVRSNVMSIGSDAREELVDAILFLKSLQSPFETSLSFYDQLVHFHQLSVVNARLSFGYSISHQCPAFLPWHRKILMLFENAVRVHIRQDFALPYWDWTDDSSLDVVFTDEFMGPYLGDSDDNYSISTSAFAKGLFSINLTASQLSSSGDPNSNCPFPFITRGPKSVDLPTAEEVEALLEVTTYDSEPFDLTADIDTSFRNYLLGVSPLQLHSVPHIWLGGQWDSDISNGSFDGTESSTFVGTMSALDCSPNDPVFWIHHCNVDRIWAAWEARYGASYEPTSGWNEGWNLNDELYPYLLYKNNPEMMKEGITNASMLDFESLGYTYDDLYT